MNIDSLYAIGDCSVETLTELVERIKVSSTLEQLIYRECELDEIWRLLDGSVEIAKKENPDQVSALSEQRQLIHDAHDFIGDDMDIESAVKTIEKVIARLK